MRLILVRHGETEWNREGRFQGQSPVGLSEKGIRQARETAKALVAMKPTAIYSSPLTRAMMTANEIGKAVSLEVTPLEGIKEVHLGEMEGITGREMRDRFSQFYATWRRDPSQAVFPAGESMRQLQERAWNAIIGLERAHPNGAVVAVSHNFAIRTILCRFMGLPLSRFHRLRVDLASVGVLQTNGSNRQMLAMNERCHLPEEVR
ncbi:MAG: histidine phosphatase family protein [Dehalococcoidia bacterium]|nr:histidine phosphatase family protein [Dehalococcoidia bacterium]